MRVISWPRPSCMLSRGQIQFKWDFLVRHCVPTASMKLAAGDSGDLNAFPGELTRRPAKAFSSESSDGSKPREKQQARFEVAAQIDDRTLFNAKPSRGIRRRNDIRIPPGHNTNRIRIRAGANGIDNLVRLESLSEESVPRRCPGLPGNYADIGTGAISFLEFHRIMMEFLDGMNWRRSLKNRNVVIAGEVELELEAGRHRSSGWSRPLAKQLAISSTEAGLSALLTLASAGLIANCYLPIADFFHASINSCTLSRTLFT